ncbi:MAG: sensor histidine kinase [Anaerovoracaceae bacterium]
MKYYVKKYLPYIFIWAEAAALFIFLGALGRMPATVWRYALLLSFAVLAIFIILTAAVDSRKSAAIIEHRQSFPEQDLPLPEASTPEEKELDDALSGVQQSLTELIDSTERDKADMLDYYTMWVHQIKTPISAMELLLHGKEGNDADEMRLELRNISMYADMVLSYQRLKSKQTDFVFRRQPLDDIIKGAVKKQSVFFIHRHITLDFSPTELSVVTDEKWLDFVIGQIVSNALKYTPDGGVVKIYRKDPASPVLVIEDNGIGISAEDLPRIFERGFTGVNGRSDKKATGIGLYLCREVLGRLGCGISAVSAEGRGTKIFITFDDRKYMYE